MLPIDSLQFSFSIKMLRMGTYLKKKVRKENKLHC